MVLEVASTDWVLANEGQYNARALAALGVDPHNLDAHPAKCRGRLRRLRFRSASSHAALVRGTPIALPLCVGSEPQTPWVVQDADLDLGGVEDWDGALLDQEVRCRPKERITPQPRSAPRPACKQWQPLSDCWRGARHTDVIYGGGHAIRRLSRRGTARGLDRCAARPRRTRLERTVHIWPTDVAGLGHLTRALLDRLAQLRCLTPDHQCPRATSTIGPAVWASMQS